jgi:hypothetical protein
VADAVGTGAGAAAAEAVFEAVGEDTLMLRPLLGAGGGVEAAAEAAAEVLVELELEVVEGVQMSMAVAVLELELEEEEDGAEPDVSIALRTKVVKSDSRSSGVAAASTMARTTSSPAVKSWCCRTQHTNTPHRVT